MIPARIAVATERREHAVADESGWLERDLFRRERRRRRIFAD